MSVNKTSNQEAGNMNMEVQHGCTQNAGQGVNVSMPKEKNIMEIFINIKGKERKSTNGALKATIVGSFKSQKPKKLNNHRGKAKSLLTSTGLIEPILVHDTGQREMGDHIMNPKPPYPDILPAEMKIISEET